MPSSPTSLDSDEMWSFTVIIGTEEESDKTLPNLRNLKDLADTKLSPLP